MLFYKTFIQYGHLACNIFRSNILLAISVNLKKKTSHGLDCIHSFYLFIYLFTIFIYKFRYHSYINFVDTVIDLCKIESAYCIAVVEILQNLSKLF